jgi:hypothetical protein
MRTNKEHNELLDALAIVVDEALDTEDPSEFRISLDEHDDLLAFLSGLRTDVCDECGDDLTYDKDADKYLPCYECQKNTLTGAPEKISWVDAAIDAGLYAPAEDNDEPIDLQPPCPDRKKGDHYCNGLRPPFAPKEGK